MHACELGWGQGGGDNSRSTLQEKEGSIAWHAWVCMCSKEDHPAPAEKHALPSSGREKERRRREGGRKETWGLWGIVFSSSSPAWAGMWRRGGTGLLGGAGCLSQEGETCERKARRLSYRQAPPPLLYFFSPLPAMLRCLKQAKENLAAKTILSNFLIKHQNFICPHPPQNIFQGHGMCMCGIEGEGEKDIGLSAAQENDRKGKEEGRSFLVSHGRMGWMMEERRRGMGQGLLCCCLCNLLDPLPFAGPIACPCLEHAHPPLQASPSPPPQTCIIQHCLSCGIFVGR